MKDELKLIGISLRTREGKEISLTMEDAKSLYEQLSELFGSKFDVVPPIVLPSPCDWPTQYPKPQIWYSSTTAQESSGISKQE